MIAGLLTALLTPFADDGGLDEARFAALVERQIAAGVDGLVPAGTTGEAATLTMDEHIRVVALCVATARGRVPVVAGAGANSTARAIELARIAKTEGADAAMVVTPFYNKPNAEGVFRHFEAIAAAVQIPLVLYNVPSRTGVDVAPETLARIAALPNVIAIKDATGDMGRLARHRALCPEDFVQLSGDDPSLIGHFAHGGAGIISVVANLAPALAAEQMRALRAGDFAAARAIDDRFAPLVRALFLEPSPGPLKAAASMLGLCGEALRLPLAPATEPTRRALAEALAHAGLA